MEAWSIESRMRGEFIGGEQEQILDFSGLQKIGKKKMYEDSQERVEN